MGNPSVSVIVPVYKVEQYVKLCVDSILAQTFQDFEIILVDDASPDGSVALCRKLYGDNDKVKFVHHEKNLGLGAARNTGMKHASGKYVYFVDSDDLILPDALEKFYYTAEQTGAEVVHAASFYELYQDEPAPILRENLKATGDFYQQEGFLSTDLPYRLDEHWKKYNTCSMAWLCFCRRDFLESNGIEFLPIISEDETFSFALFYYARRYYVLSANLYVYRRRTGSIMQTRDAARLAKVIQSMARGSAYIKSFLDRIPRFDGYDTWRKDIMDTFFNRFVYVHTINYYGDLSLSPEVTAAADDALEKLFGENAPFVSNFFHGYHMFLCQSEILDQQAKLLQAEIQRLKGEQNDDAIVAALKSAEKRVLLLGTPTHGNLGDQAIVAGELRVLKDYFPEHAVIEVPYDYLAGGLGFAKHVRRDDLIFMHGGGNLGNLWLNEEQLRRALIDAFPDNKIIIFPQSICFTADDTGRRELAISQRVYNTHDDLHLMTRDEVSFEFAQKFFPRVNNYLMPDAATVLHGMLDDADVAREGVLFVLRGDKEKVRDDAKIQVLQESFAEAGIPFEVVDTVINEQVTAETRDEKIRAALLKIRKSKLVVTDRFHGVVFAFITRTPVLAFKSLDTKISSGVKWFENFPSVFYAEDTDWNAVETFINLAFDDAAVFVELDSSVKIDGEALFFDALNQIVGAQKKNLLNDNRVKKVFTLHIPLSVCNLLCHYCYVAQHPEQSRDIQPHMNYSPEQVARALSPQRLGGLAYFNICADGETLLLKDLDIYVKRLVEQGHYCEIVTNCTITPMLEKILSFDKELLERIEFKCSFHYLELKKKNMLALFAKNVNKIWDAGASANIEITPSDELIPYIDEVKDFSLKNFGALPHITIARDDRTEGIDILSRLPKAEYYKTWGQFDSAFFDYKTTIFGKRQEDFCYAGLWSAWINLGTGQARACYCGKYLGDVFANPESPFPTWPVGKCTLPHCYNAHVWMTFGLIPNQTNVRYGDIRNRVRADGREWLQPKLKEFFNTKLCDNNAELSDAEKLKFMIMNRLS